MLMPSPNHGTQRLPNDDDDERSHWPIESLQDSTYSIQSVNRCHKLCVSLILFGFHSYL